MANAVSATATFLLLVAAAYAIPVRYDQRQDGDWNVDARLQNFFVVFSPKGINSPNGGINILDIASKAIPIRPGSGLAAAAAAAAAATGGAPSEPQERQGQPGDVAELVLVPAGRSAIPGFAAPDAAAGVPMLVAVPVPEVAPLSGGAFVSGVALQSGITANHIQPQLQPSALLPMLSVIKPGTTDKIIPVQSIPAEALPTTLESERAPASSEGAPNPAPGQQAAPQQQVTPVQAAEVAPVAAVQDKVVLRLVGTGIEDCGPLRVRNENGVCVEARN